MYFKFFREKNKIYIVLNLNKIEGSRITPFRPNIKEKGVFIMQKTKEIEEIRKFLKTLFPIEEEKNRYIEIRPISAKGDKITIKTKERFVKTVDEAVKIIIDIKRKIEKGEIEESNIYVGVAYRWVAYSGAKNRCKDIYCVFADLDCKKIGVSLGINEVKKYIKKHFKLLPTMYVKSGNGYHLYWKLSKRENNIKAIEQILKAIAVKINADIDAAEFARILRVPNTINYKNRTSVELVEINDNVYDIDELAEGLGIKIQKKVSNIYTTENIKMFCVKKMFEDGVPDGYRNFAMGRIIAYFKKVGYTKQKTKAILWDWNAKNTPPIDYETFETYFEAYWKRPYKLLGCLLQDQQKQDMLNVYCSKFECRINSNFADAVRVIEEDAVSINNRVFVKERYSKMTGLALLLLVEIAYQGGINRTELAKRVNKHERNKNFIESLRFLVKHKYIFEIKGIRKKGIPNTYRINSTGTFGLGYTIVNPTSITLAVNGIISLSAFKLYVLMKRYCFQKDSAYPSQATLASMIGVTERQIRNLIIELENARLLKRLLMNAEDGIYLYYKVN